MYRVSSIVYGNEDITSLTVYWKSEIWPLCNEHLQTSENIMQVSIFSALITLDQSPLIIAF